MKGASLPVTVFKRRALNPFARNSFLWFIVAPGLSMQGALAFSAALRRSFGWHEFD
jgi:hypothetical protein